MVVVVPVLAFAPDPLDELVAAERRSRPCWRHIRTSMPSKATSQPAASTRARSGESSRSSGLVLFKWMKIRRCALSPSRRARLPSGPPTGTVGHVLRALGAEPERGQLVAGPEGPVEEHAVGGRRASRRTVSVTAPTPGQVGQRPPGRALADTKPMLSCGIGRGAGLRGGSSSLPGTATASTWRPDARPSRSARSSSLPSWSERHVTWPWKAIERPVQDVAVRESTRECGRSCRPASGCDSRRDREAQAVIEIAVSQHDRARWASGAGREDEAEDSLDLLADLRRAVQQKPSIAVGADGHGFLRCARSPPSPARTPRQLGQPQFHCGNPPPAAEPSTRISIVASPRATRPFPRLPAGGKGCGATRSDCGARSGRPARDRSRPGRS